jgi:hypothetical protein
MNIPPRIVFKNTKNKNILDDKDYKIFLLWRYRNITALFHYNKQAQLLIYMIYVLRFSRAQIMELDFVSKRQYYKLTKYLKTTDNYAIPTIKNYFYLK